MVDESEIQISIVKKKIIQSLLYPKYEVMNICFCRLYTCATRSKCWLYSGIEGALTLAIDIKFKSAKFYIYDTSTFETLFECELYKKFENFYQKKLDTFHCFEINQGFIGFEIPNIENANNLHSIVQNLTEEWMKKKFKPITAFDENTKKEKAEANIKLLQMKIANEGHNQCYSDENELEVNQKELDDMINCIEVDQRSKTVTFFGSGYGPVENLVKKMLSVNVQLKRGVKIVDEEKFVNLMATNICTSFANKLLAPQDTNAKRRAPKPRQNKQKIVEEENGREEQKPQQTRPDGAIAMFPMGLMPGMPRKDVKHEEPPQQTAPAQLRRQETKPPQAKPQPKTSVKTTSKPLDYKNVKVVSGKGKGVPPPPPLLINQVTAPQQTQANQPKIKKELSMEEQVALSKKNLAHVEVKEYVSPALRKPGEEPPESSSGGGNSFMSQLMNMRSKMLNKGGAPQGQPPQQSFNQPQHSFNQPQQSFNPPQQSFNQPQHSFNPPQQSFNQPQQSFNRSATKKPETQQPSYKAPILKQEPPQQQQPVNQQPAGGNRFQSMLQALQKKNSNQNIQKPSFYQSNQSNQGSLRSSLGTSQNTSFQPQSAQPTTNQSQTQRAFPSNFPSRQPSISTNPPNTSTTPSAQTAAANPFAARIAALANRMGGGGNKSSASSSTTTSQPPENTKPIVEYAASSNVAKMDINKLINNASKAMDKGTKSSGPIKPPKVVAGKGKGIPPPPPPPPSMKKAAPPKMGKK